VEISIPKHQAKLNSCSVQTKQDLSLLEKLLMSQLWGNIECYLSESDSGSPKAWYCQKLQWLLQEEIAIYRPCIFISFS